MALPPDEEIVSLQRAVISAADDARRVGLLIGWGGGLGLLALAAVLLAFAGRTAEIPIVAVGCGILGFGVPAVVIGYCFALPLARLYQAAHQRRLREPLAPLPPEMRASVLQPLRTAGGDTTEMVERLIVDLRSRPTELTPAAAPAGSGNEVAGETPPDGQEKR
jgi:hypothetical protein